jgi:hypothetical protein
MSVAQPQVTASQPITRLTIAPGSGVIAEAITLELFNRGLTDRDRNHMCVRPGPIVARTRLTIAVTKAGRSSGVHLM